MILALAVVLTLPKDPRVRSIDRLVHLLHDRLALARDVAEAKFNSGAPIADLKREAAVVNTAVTLAAKMRGPAFQVRILFLTQIEASKIAQTAFIRSWAGHAKFVHPPDLARDVRPKLDRLTVDIVQALADAQPALHGAFHRAVVEDATHRYSFVGRGDQPFQLAWRRAVAPLR
jgi:chorismate mutase